MFPLLVRPNPCWNPRWEPRTGAVLMCLRGATPPLAAINRGTKQREAFRRRWCRSRLPEPTGQSRFCTWASLPATLARGSVIS
jgi:hypothetical protein